MISEPAIIRAEAVVPGSGDADLDNEARCSMADPTPDHRSFTVPPTVAALGIAAFIAGAFVLICAVLPAAGSPAAFATVFAALLAAHFVGDYWVQTDHQAQHKGTVITGPLIGPDRVTWAARWNATGRGWVANLSHVATYTATAALFVGAAEWRTSTTLNMANVAVALAVSAITHAWADRRHTLAWLARVTGSARFCGVRDNGMNGALLLDQAWHIGWLFLAGLIAA